MIALIALLSPVAACDCGGSTSPSGRDVAVEDADVGGGIDAISADSGQDTAEDTAEDAGQDTSEDTSEDTGGDASEDTGGDTSDDTGEERTERSVVFTSSGGGVVQSENTRAVIGLGAPQPAGSASGENNSITTGSGAARP